MEEVTKEEETLPWKEAFIRYTDIQYNTIPRMSLKQWLNMWGRLCYGAAGISDFPIWVQLLPELFFDVGDRDGRLNQNLENLVNNIILITCNHFPGSQWGPLLFIKVTAF